MPLSNDEQAHLDNAIEVEAGRREVDRDLPSLTRDRDVLLRAATNLESGQPQADPSTAAALRALADEWVRADMLAARHGALRGKLAIIVLPNLRRACRQVEDEVGDFGSGLASAAPNRGDG